MNYAKSNQAAGETTDKIVSEMKAGVELLRGPKPDRDLIDILLKRPLKFVAEKGAGAIVQKIALVALDLRKNNRALVDEHCAAFVV